MSKAVVFFAEGTEECEALLVVDLLRRAKVEVTIASATGNRAITSSHKVHITADALAEDIDYSDVDMVVLPGGIPGMPNLRACEPLCDALVKHAADGRGVAAICASPSILAELGILEGKRATANPHFQNVVTEHGGVLEADKKAVTDGNVITSQGMATAVWFGLEIVKRYVPAEVVEHVKEGIVLMD